MGTGMSALTVGALLANSGKKICMVEAHDHPGGMAHSFTMGDYTFCAQVHYIWGCAPGGRIYEFLNRIGLEKDITFELFDTNGVMFTTPQKLLQDQYERDFSDIFPMKGRNNYHCYLLYFHQLPD